ncbi:MAG: sensor domain CHASE-containing protein, partial [Motiliproteus sp.]
MMNMDAHFTKGGMARTIVFPLIYVIVAVAVSMLSVVLYSAQQANLHAKYASETQLRFILKDRQSQLEALTRDYAYWDDTILNAFYTQNMEWIDSNIGSYLTDSFGISEILIVDNNNKVVLSLKDGRPVTGIQQLSGEVKSLILRARESGSVSESGSESVSGMLLIDGFPALVGASVLTPEGENSKQVPAPQPVLVLAKRFDADRLAEIAKNVGLTDLQLQREGAHRALKASPFIEMHSPDDTVLGRLTWVQYKPGTLVIDFMVKPLVILFFVVVFFGLYLLSTPRLQTQQWLVTQQRVSEFYEFLIMRPGSLPLLSVLFTALFWIIDAWVDLVIFKESESMLE